MAHFGRTSPLWTYFNIVHFRKVKIMQATRVHISVAAYGVCECNAYFLSSFIYIEIGPLEANYYVGILATPVSIPHLNEAWGDTLDFEVSN